MTALNSWLYRGNGRGRLEGQAPGGGRRRGLRGGKKRGPHFGASMVQTSGSGDLGESWTGGGNLGMGIAEEKK